MEQSGADTGLLRGEGILQDCAQCACANYWPHPLSASHDGRYSMMATMPRQRIMVLSSEIIEIIAESPWISCTFCILWTKGRSLVQGGNCWAWREGGMCPVFPTPGSAPDNTCTTYCKRDFLLYVELFIILLMYFLSRQCILITWHFFAVSLTSSWFDDINPLNLPPPPQIHPCLCSCLW